MKIRSFIAIEIPNPIQDVIARQTANLRKLYPYPKIRWVKPDNIHLTLKFLGNMSTSDLDKIAETISKDASLITPFSISFSGLGIFPNARKPRIIWMGISSPPILLEFQSRIESILSNFGIQMEKRPFSPHITLGRFGDDQINQNIENLVTELRSLNVSVINEVNISAIEIFKSDLKPDGPVYTSIHHIPLGNKINPKGKS